MTTAFTATVSVDRPVAEVWAYLTDWNQAGAWMSGVDAIESAGRDEVGTEVVFHTRGRRRTGTVTASVPGRSLTLTSVQGGVRAAYAYTCEPAEDGARVSLLVDVTASGLWTLAGGLVRRAIRRADGDQLDVFKRAVETGADRV